MSYFFPVEEVAASCPSGYSRALGADVRVVVSGKGELSLRTAPSACLSVAALEYLNPAKQGFTITAGTGMYAGASGNGTVTRDLVLTSEGASGTETWTGTLTVPGLAFDVTAPTLTGATAKTVRVPKKAKNARVTFNVTAADDVDDRVPVACQPRSGSRFKVGKTTVRCEATDSSGNTTKASFVITVKRVR